MSQSENTQTIHETSRLLTELDRVLDESSVIRDLASSYQRLHAIERITGPSRVTRALRKKILLLENRLRLVRG